MTNDLALEHLANKKSIASRLFRIVFSIYFFVTLCLTLAQMYTEYNHTKQEVLREIELLVSTIKPVLVQSIWDYDIARIKLINNILSKQSTISGVIITDEKGELLINDFQTLDTIKTRENVDSVNNQDRTGKNKIEFELIYPGKRQIIGNAVLYFSDDVVLQRVQYGYVLIIINSLLKTIALWAIFLIVSRYILAKPMAQLIDIIRKINLENLEKISIKLKNKGYDELKIIEDTLGKMVQNLINARQKITENAKELEEKNLRLEQIDRLKDEFLANTSHELRTPLHGMIGIANSLKEHLANKENFQVQFNLDMIGMAGKHLSVLVDDILDFSNLKNKTLKLQRKPVDIQQILNIVLQISKPLIKDKHLLVETEFPKDLPTAYADENRVQQIFQNLIGNAVKFTEKEVIHVKARKINADIEISVTTMSEPIAPSNYQSIFEAFEQLDGSINRKYRGAGLGLAIVKKLVELHQGRIWITSNVTEGNSFIFTLPIADTSDIGMGKKAVIETIGLEPDVPIALVQSQHNKNALFDILVVDDDVTNLQVILNYLSPYGYSINCVKSGKEALKWVETHGKPDLVLLDIMMPQTSGFEVCQLLRKKFAIEVLPIIFLTASHRRKDIETGFSIGANDYLTKPFEKSELLSRIRVHLKNLLALKQLQLLRDCANQIASFNEHEQMLNYILDQMIATRLITDAVLFKEEALYKAASSPAEFLNQLPDNSLLDQYFNSPNNDIFIANSIKENDMVQTFYQEHNSKPDLIGGHLIFLKPSFCQENLICLYRSRERMPFSELDVEFMSNVMDQIQTIEENIQTMLSNQLVQALPDIQPHLSRIIYISSSAPICSIYIDHEPNPKDIKISLSSLDLYFNNTSLLRIHRSYLINPNKIITIKKQFVGNKKYRYEALVGQKDRTYNLRIGDSYVKKLMKIFPHFFVQA